MARQTTSGSDRLPEIRSPGAALSTEYSWSTLYFLLGLLAVRRLTSSSGSGEACRQLFYPGPSPELDLTNSERAELSIYLDTMMPPPLHVFDYITAYREVKHPGRGSDVSSFYCPA